MVEYYEICGEACQGNDVRECDTEKEADYVCVHDYIELEKELEVTRKALGVACGLIKKRSCPDSDFRNGCKVDKCDGCLDFILEKARKEIANGK